MYKMTNACLVKLLHIKDFGYVWLAQVDLKYEYATLFVNNFIKQSCSFSEENGIQEQKMYVLSDAGEKLVNALLAVANLGL